MAELQLQPGRYPGHHVITGAPFQIGFWTIATDISPADATGRMEFAGELVRRWNEGEK